MARLTVVGVTAYAQECGYELTKISGGYKLSCPGYYAKYRNLDRVLTSIDDGKLLSGHCCELPNNQVIAQQELDIYIDEQSEQVTEYQRCIYPDCPNPCNIDCDATYHDASIGYCIDDIEVIQEDATEFNFGANVNHLHRCLSASLDEMNPQDKVIQKIQPFLEVFENKNLDGESIFHKLRYFERQHYYLGNRELLAREYRDLYLISEIGKDYESEKFWLACDRFLDYLISLKDVSQKRITI